MIQCKAIFDDKVFSTKEEFQKHVRENVDEIIRVKKASVYESLGKGALLSAFIDYAGKTAEQVKVGPQMKEGYIYPVINSCNYFDSHWDVHFDGIWNRSAKDQNGKLFYVLDHEVKTGTIIAWPEDVNVMVKNVPWSFINMPYEGTTDALIYEIDKNKIVSAVAKEIVDNRRPVQNSVRMQYVTIKLGMNSSRKDDVEYKKYYDDHIDLIVNKEEVIDGGEVFFGVEEAKIVTEGSMVIRGSNRATPVRQKQPVTATSTTVDIPGAATSTPKETIFINPNLF
jgi:hypothetical protein